MRNHGVGLWDAREEVRTCRVGSVEVARSLDLRHPGCRTAGVEMWNPQGCGLEMPEVLREEDG